MIKSFELHPDFPDDVIAIFDNGKREIISEDDLLNQWENHQVTLSEWIEQLIDEERD